MKRFKITLLLLCLSGSLSYASLEAEKLQVRTSEATTQSLATNYSLVTRNVSYAKGVLTGEWVLKQHLFLAPFSEPQWSVSGGKFSVDIPDKKASLVNTGTYTGKAHTCQGYEIDCAILVTIMPGPAIEKICGREYDYSHGHYVSKTCVEPSLKGKVTITAIFPNAEITFKTDYCTSKDDGLCGIFGQGKALEFAAAPVELDDKALAMCKP